ncbi:MAG: ribosome maturation factor RimP [bacterium]|nr:ribosome maturation factor RimP [bacterium]
MDVTRHEQLVSAVNELTRDVVAQVGLELVEIRLRGSSRRRTLRVDIDRAGPAGINLDDCQRASHAIGEALEESDLIPGSYVLEVSSPGADRPIQSAEDIRRNTGRKILVETDDPEAGRKTYRGVLLGSADGGLSIRDSENQEVHLPLETIQIVHQDVGFDHE